MGVILVSRTGVHSRCATQRNEWDGINLEGVPEEVLEPYVTISNGVIEHFSHQQHHLRLDENIHRDYDEKKLCQACTTPIYFGNFYYCLQCDDFILHEKCANLSRPIHPHLLTLVGGYNGADANLCYYNPNTSPEKFHHPLFAEAKVGVNKPELLPKEFTRCPRLCPLSASIFQDLT